MRTVILNTLDAVFAKKDVFYRAFAPDQVEWYEYGLDRLDSFATHLTSHLQQTMIRRDYHLVVLVDMEHFRFSEFSDVRDVLKRIVLAHLNHQLMPVLEREDMLPACTSVIFTYFRNRTDSAKGRDLYTLLLCEDAPQPSSRHILSYKRRGSPDNFLDLSALFAEAESFPEEEKPVSPEVKVPEIREDAPEDVDELLAVANSRRDEDKEKIEQAVRRQDYLESVLRKGIEKRQSYRTAANPDCPLHPIVHELPFQMKESGLANADLQINLARMIREISQNKQTPVEAAQNFKILPHGESELVELLDNAQDIVQKCRLASGKAYYYALTAPYATTEAGEVEAKIRTRLRKEVDNVPGIQDAIDVLDRSASTGTDEQQDQTGSKLNQHVRASWFRVGREKKRFQSLYRILQEQYDPAKVKEDQKKIFDICSDEFLTWRTEKRKEQKVTENKASQELRPIIPEEQRSALAEAREQSSKGVLERLNDFSDVREEGAQLHTQFRAATRFWSPDRRERNTKLFYRFAFLSAIVFVLLMALPFILIESLEADIQISEVLLFAIYYAGFLALYAVGVLHWLKKMCKTLHQLSEELEDLIERSAEKRKESILSAVATYGRLLPECLLQQMNLDAIEAADERNAHLEQLRVLHLGYLNDAMVEIQNMRTALRLPTQAKSKTRSVEIMFDQAPYAPCNQEAYMFFHEGGGKR